MTPPESSEPDGDNVVNRGPGTSASNSDQTGILIPDEAGKCAKWSDVAPEIDRILKLAPRSRSTTGE